MFRHMCLPALMCLNKGDYLVLCITCDFLLAQFNKRMIYILKIVTAATSNSKGIQAPKSVIASEKIRSVNSLYASDVLLT